MAVARSRAAAVSWGRRRFKGIRDQKMDPGSACYRSPLQGKSESARRRWGFPPAIRVITALTLQSCPLGKSHDATTQATAPGKARPHTQNGQGCRRRGHIREANESPKSYRANGTSQQNVVRQLSDIRWAIALGFNECLRAVQKQISKRKRISRRPCVDQKLSGGVNEIVEVVVANIEPYATHFLSHHTITCMERDVLTDT